MPSKPKPLQRDTTGTDPALAAQAADVSMRVVNKWLTERHNAATVDDGRVTLPLQSLYNLAGLCLYLGMEMLDARRGDG